MKYKARGDSSDRNGERARRYRAKRESLKASSDFDQNEARNDQALVHGNNRTLPERNYPWLTLKKRLVDCSWLQASAQSERWLAKYVLNMLRMHPAQAHNPSAFFKQARPVKGSGLFDKDLMARSIAMINTSYGTEKKIKRALANVDFEQHRTPESSSQGMIGWPFDENGLFGLALAENLLEILRQWCESPMLLVDEFEKVDPLEVLSVLSVLQWSNKQREDYRDLDTWNVHGQALLLMMLLFQDFWIRPLADWRPPCLDVSENLQSLLTHLFLVYPIPACLSHKLNGDQHSSVNIHTFLWAIFLGRGVSLHRVADSFGWHVPKGFVAALHMTKSDDAPLDITCLRAEAARLGADPKIIRFIEFEFQDVCSSFSYGLHSRCEFADLFHDDANMDFITPAASEAEVRIQFKNLVLWFVRNSPNLERGEARQIAAWMRHLFSEALRENQTLLLQGSRFNLANVRRSIQRFGEEIRQLGDFRNRITDKRYPEPWPYLGLDLTHIDESGLTWTFTQLLTSADLKTEGILMNHCVGSYSYRCAKGSSAIFSVQRNGLRVATIELSPDTLKIMQIKAEANQRPSPETLHATEVWLTKIRHGSNLPKPQSD